MEKNIYTCSGKLKTLFPLFILFLILTLYGSEARNCGKLYVVPTDIRSFTPWTVAIFRRVGGSNSRWKFHTSGTIISTERVASSQIGPPGRFPSDNDPRNFLIVAGVNTTDFSKHDEFAQYSLVKFIRPQKSLYQSFFHYVMYYVETPLDFSTPFVKTFCPVTSPIFAAILNPKNQFLQFIQTAAQGSITIPFPISGFASRRKGAKYGNETQNSNTIVWTLKVWKIVVLPHKVCVSIFRFHYGNSLSPTCFRRTFDNASSIFSGDRILQKIQVASEYSQHDHEMCFSHGSRANVDTFGVWNIGAEVTLIPRQKWQRCGFNTVYFSSVSANSIEEMIFYNEWLLKVERCGDTQFPCVSRNSNQCIPLNQTCDNNPDCEDESDEHPDICAWKTGRKEKTEVESVDMQTSLDLDPRDVTRRCPDFEFGLDGVCCIDPDTLEDVNCTSPFYYGRRIRVECDKFYRAPKYSFDHMDLFCNFDGQWEGLRPILCQKECGVFDGTNKSNSNFPWEVTIWENGVETCGGTLIQPFFVLTDGRCVKNWTETSKYRSTIQISLADEKSVLKDQAANFQIRNSWVSNHSGSLENLYENSIALIQLLRPMEPSAKDLDFVMAACFLVPPLRKIFSEQVAMIGSNKSVGVSRENCDAAKSEGFCTTSSLGQVENNNNPLGLGDVKIGAGLFLRRLETSTGKSKHILQGIYSGATKDGRGTFTNVDSYADWILDILEANS